MRNIMNQTFKRLKLSNFQKTVKAQVQTQSIFYNQINLQYLNETKLNCYDAFGYTLPLKRNFKF